MTTRRHENDFYPTPPLATRALAAVEAFRGDIWEPACGNGAISDVLSEKNAVISTDLHDYGFGASNADFLAADQLLAPNIVTNPPYKHAQAFIQKAIDLGAEKHCWLLRLSFLESKRRKAELLDVAPPSRVWVFAKRLTIWRGDEAPTSTGTTAYAWFVWDRGTTDTKIGWI